MGPRDEGERMASERTTSCRSGRVWTGLLACGLLIGLTACVGTRSGNPYARGQAEEEINRRGERAAVGWQEVHIGQLPNPAHRGYLESPRGGHRFVHDLNFQRVGRISAEGATYRIAPSGQETFEGNFALEHALLVVFGHREELPVHLRPLAVQPAPGAPGPAEAEPAE